MVEQADGPRRSRTRPPPLPRSHVRPLPPPRSRAQLVFLFVRLIPLAMLVVGLFGPWGTGSFGCHGPERVISGIGLLILAPSEGGGGLVLVLAPLLLPWLLRFYLPRSRVVLWIYCGAVAILLLLAFGFLSMAVRVDQPRPLEVIWGAWVFFFAVFVAAAVEVIGMIVLRNRRPPLGRTSRRTGLSS